MEDPNVGGHDNAVAITDGSGFILVSIGRQNAIVRTESY